MSDYHCVRIHLSPTVRIYTVCMHVAYSKSHFLLEGQGRGTSRPENFAGRKWSLANTVPAWLVVKENQFLFTRNFLERAQLTGEGHSEEGWSFLERTREQKADVNEYRRAERHWRGRGPVIRMDNGDNKRSLLCLSSWALLFIKPLYLDQIAWCNDERLLRKNRCFIVENLRHFFLSFFYLPLVLALRSINFFFRATTYRAR